MGELDFTLYRLALCISLPLMIFFGIHMLVARVPGHDKVSSYLLSRRLVGAALLLLSSNYVVHAVFAVRFIDICATILFNMATYFLCYWLFTAAMMALLDRKYVTSRLFLIHFLLWVLYSACCLAVAFLPETAERWGTVLLSCGLSAYGLILATRILLSYRRATRMFENTRSDDMGAYIRWLSIFTYWAVIYGVSCGFLTFLPEDYVFVWILSAIPFYIFLYCSYQNYIFFHDVVERAFIEDVDIALVAPSVPEDLTPDMTKFRSDVAEKVEGWIDAGGYLTPGVTLNDICTALGTNRTYLSEFINRVYRKSFRDWIADLRIEYAKQLMENNPSLRIQEVSEKSGFLSLSHFSRTFKDKEGCTPAKWRERKA